jgi:hypothetical protein
MVAMEITQQFVLSGQSVEGREDASEKARKNIGGLVNPPKIRRCSSAGKMDGGARKEGRATCRAYMRNTPKSDLISGL